MSILEIGPDTQTDVTARLGGAEESAEPASTTGHVPGTPHDPAPTVVEDESAQTSETPGPVESGPTTVPGTRPTFTITDAAAACGVSRKTITRKLPDLASHGAAKDDDGVWRIPVEALLAVGLHPGRSLPPSGTRSATAGSAAGPAVAKPVAPTAAPASGGPAPRSQAPEPAPADVVSVPRDRWDDLRLRLAKAEAEAAERALALADARLALRALTAVPHTPSPPAAPTPQQAAWSGSTAGTPAPVAEEPAQPVKKRRWWQSGY